MRIILDDAIPGADTLFSKIGEVTRFPGRALTRNLLLAADALIVRSVTPVHAAMVEGTPIRFVGTATSGCDHIDVSGLAKSGIHFAHAAGCNARPVAEFVFTAIHEIARRQGRDPQNLTLGVVGTGHVGTIVVEIARRLGLRTLHNDPPRARAGSLPDHLPLDALLRDSDVLTLHVPLIDTGVDSTANLIGAAQLAIAKPGLILINAARGGILDETSALNARRAGRLAAVVLDVWHNEPHLRRDLLDAADIATPHLAGYSAQSKRRGAAMIFTQLAHHARWSGAAELDAAEFIHAPDPRSISPEPENQPRAGNPPPTGESLEPRRETLDRIASVLIAACPIHRADSELRSAAADGTLDDAFDRIRRRFADRSEFSNTALPDSITDPATLAALHALGFPSRSGVPNV